MKQALFTAAQTQSELILPVPLPLGSLAPLTQEIVGFFIVENHVLRNTGDFRSLREVEELWDALLRQMNAGIQYSLKMESDAEVYLSVKETLLSFITTLEV